MLDESFDNERCAQLTIICTLCSSTPDIMLCVFVAPPTEGHTADHKNRIRHDNKLSNLRRANNSEQKLNRTFFKMSATCPVLPDDWKTNDNYPHLWNKNLTVSKCGISLKLRNPAGNKNYNHFIISNVKHKKAKAWQCLHKVIVERNSNFITAQ